MDSMWTVWNSVDSLWTVWNSLDIRKESHMIFQFGHHMVGLRTESMESTLSTWSPLEHMGECKVLHNMHHGWLGMRGLVWSYSWQSQEIAEGLIYHRVPASCVLLQPS